MRRRHAGHRTGLALWQTSFARNMPMRIASRVIPIPWFQSAGIIYTNRTLCHQVRLHIQQSSSRCCSSPYRFVSRTFRRACKIVAIKRASANPRRRDGKTSRTTIQGHNAMCPRRDDFGLAVRPRPIDGGRQTSLPRRSRMNETPGVGSCRRLAFRRERSGLMSEDGGRDFRPSEPLVRILLWLSPRSQAGRRHGSNQQASDRSSAIRISPTLAIRFGAGYPGLDQCERLSINKLERIAPADNTADGRRGKVRRTNEGGSIADLTEELSPCFSGLRRIII